MTVIVVTVTVFSDCVVTVPKSRRLGFSEDVDKTRPHTKKTRPQKQDKTTKTRQDDQNKTNDTTTTTKTKDNTKPSSTRNRHYLDQSTHTTFNDTGVTDQWSTGEEKKTEDSESLTSGAQEKPQQRTVSH